MAFTAPNGKRITKRNVQTWQRQVETGKRSKVEIERDELGDTTSRGKRLTRLFASELGQEGLVLR